MDTIGLPGSAVIDDQLMDRIAKDDLAALEALYDRSSLALFTLALRMLGRQEEAAATVADVFSDLWRKAVRYDRARGTVMAWLFAMTRTRAIERLSARTPRVPSHATPLDTGPVAPSDSEVLKGEFDPDSAARRKAAQAFATLPADSRELLEGAYFEGLTVSTMATRLHETPEAVRDKLCMGMRLLRRALPPSQRAPLQYGT